MLLFILKSALRNLIRSKQNAFIIILSLSISFAFSNILITFVSFESNTDQFHTKKDKIFRLFSDDPFELGRKLRYIQGDMTAFLRDNYPEVNNICEVSALRRRGNTLVVDEKEIQEQLILEADSTFFDFFDYQLLEGNRNNCIVKDGIVLKESLAKNLLVSPPFIDQTIFVIHGKEEKPIQVTGVMKELHENTQLKFDAIVSGHGKSGGSVFVMLNDKADPISLAQKLSENKLTPSLIGRGESAYKLEPFTATYYNPSGIQPYDQHRNKQLIIICWVVVLLLSFTASFNFINLYVVGLLSRRKEIGVKRVFGISKLSMILSIGMEVCMYIIISMVLSLVLTYYLLPFFNTTLTTQMTFSYFTYVKVFSIVIGGILAIAILVTLYLVVFTWKLNPLRLINDQQIHNVKANRFMFTVQFFISVGLVICSFVVISQMQYIKNKPLGFNKHMMQLRIEDDQKPRLHVLKEKLKSYPQFQHIAMSSGNPISGNAIVRLDLENKKVFSPFLISGDENLVETMGLTIIEGRDFQPQNKLGKLVNETFVKQLDMTNPIGQELPPGVDGFIIGVVKDFNSRSLKQEIPPYIISLGDKNLFLLIDISKTDIQQTIELVSNEWKQVFPDESMSYKLIADELLERHKEDALFFQMIISFTIASLIISCFGLYGIASFTTSRRTKEIGIRKVLGASFISIIMLIWKDYVKLIFISFILAVPVVNYFLTDWLQEFAYRIELNWWLYVIPGLVIVMIALLTISGQSIKAAFANPVDSIKDE